MTTKAFTGIPLAAFDFYEQLSAHNTKSWWAENKETYELAVKGPLTGLADELSAEFGEWRMFRPHRDTRFSKDKTPMKTHQGVTVSIEDGVGYYVQVSADGLMVAGGWYAPQGSQVDRFRRGVDGPRGPELATALARLRRTWEIGGDPLKTHPRGYPSDHPRIDLLRFRQLTVARTYGVEDWLATRRVLTTVRKDWQSITPLLEWLADTVGPAEDPSRD